MPPPPATRRLYFDRSTECRPLEACSATEVTGRIHSKARSRRVHASLAAAQASIEARAPLG